MIGARRGAVAALCAGLSFATVAGRALAEPEGIALAEALFRDGHRLLASGDVTGACGKFAESYRIDAALGTLMNLARCHQRQGKTASAWAEYTKAAAQAAAARQDDRQAFASQQAHELEGALSRLIIEGIANDDGVQVTLDGHGLRGDVLGTAIPIDPGRHHVVVSARGAVAYEVTVDLPAGPSERRIVVPPLQPVRSSPSAPPPRPAPEPLALRDVAGWTAIGTAVLAAGATVYYGVASQTRADLRRDAAADARASVRATAPELDRQAMLTRDYAFVAGSIGAAALVTGVVLLVTRVGRGAGGPGRAAAPGVRWIPSGPAGVEAEIRF